MSVPVDSIRNACLLAEVGRLKSRNGETTPEPAQHSSYLARELLNDSDAAILIEQYHADRTDSMADQLSRDVWTVRAANALASPHDDHTDPTAEPIALTSVFDPVADERLRETYDITPLTIDRETLFPTETSHSNPGGRYVDLWDSLTAAVSPSMDFETLLNTLQRYTWCVPAFPDTPSLPLYDHCRTAAAIGEALFRSELSTEQIEALTTGGEITDPCFTLVKGDLSGMQAFLHQMNNPGEAQDSLAKRMRGRSSQLWLLTTALTTLFTRHVDQSHGSLLWNGGGQFYALVPPLDTAVDGATTVAEQLEDFQTAISSELFERFGVELSCLLGRAEWDHTTSSFADLFEAVAYDTDRRKLQKARPLVQNGSAQSYLGSNRTAPRKPCPICGRTMATASDECEECALQETIGKVLPTMEYLVERPSDYHGTTPRDATLTIGSTLDGPPVTLSIADDLPTEDVSRLYTVNDYSAVESNTAVTGTVRSSHRVPYGSGIDPSSPRVWAFSELAALGRSEQPFLQVVTMDIDDLGTTVGEAMADGPARLSALGRTLSLFFEGYLDVLTMEFAVVRPTECACKDCRTEITALDSRVVTSKQDESETTFYVPKDGGSNWCKECYEAVSPIYLGYSGGDDLFFVAAWDVAITFGQRVHEELTAFSSGTLTISAGFYRSKPKYPVGRALEQSEERLSAAKATDGGEKDAVTLFEQVRTWDEMNELLGLGETIQELIEDDDLSTGTLQQLVGLILESDPRPTTAASARSRQRGIEKQWKIKYVLSRNVSDDGLDILEKNIDQLLDGISIPASWAFLSQR